MVLTVPISLSGDSDSVVGGDFTIDDITYAITEEGDVNEVMVYDAESSISSYAGTSTVLNEGVQYSVTSIGDHAFDGCTGLTSVTIPDSVTSIGNGTFYGCTGLTSVTIGDSVTYIGGYAFLGCTGLTSVTIPDSVTSIGSYAFKGCTSIISIDLGIGVTTVGPYAFADCSNLKTIFVNGDGPIESYCSAYDGCDEELEFVSGKEHLSLTLYNDPDHTVALSMDDIRSKDCTIYLKTDSGDGDHSMLTIAVVAVILVAVLGVVGLTIRRGR